MSFHYRVSGLATILLLACACSVPSAEQPPASPAPTEQPAETPPAADPVMREGFVVGDAEAEGITTLDSLVSKAKAQRSEALVVVKNGKLVYEDYFGTEDEPLVAMSASKSFTSLAFGFLLAEGKLGSIDDLVSKTLPGFASHPQKSKITYRHLLTHTSGIDPERAGGSKADIEAHALAVSCVFEPGTSWQYSNNGIDLLAALAGKLAGKPMDQYLNDKLFRPMGIADVDWQRDKKGVPLGAGEMFIRPLDLAKVGQAMIDGGKWRSVQVVPPAWPALSFAPSTTIEPLYGLLWWRDANVTGIGLTTEVIAQWQTAGLSAESAAKLEPVVGRKFPTQTTYWAAVRAAIGGNELLSLNGILQAGNHLPTYRNLEIGEVRGFNAAGWLGQFLVVIPEKNLVAVRMRRPRPADYDGGREVDGFPTFPAEVSRL